MLRDNIERLIKATRFQGKSNKQNVKAEKAANAIPLANGSSIRSFVKICEAGQIEPQADLIATGKYKPKDLPTDEQILGTDNCVFFYLGAFAYPKNEAGILYRRKLENNYCKVSSATPFDSGGLIRKFNLPPGVTSKAFFKDNELPVPGHKKLLAISLEYLFKDPSDYLIGDSPIYKSPVEISGGDRRRWTHEVRIASKIGLKKENIEAIFLMRNRVVTPGLEDFLNYCNTNDVTIKIFKNHSGGDFEGLREECIRYIKEKWGI